MIFPIGEPTSLFPIILSEKATWRRFQKSKSAFTMLLLNLLVEITGISTMQQGGRGILICVAGKGYYQEWGKEAQLLLPGDIINIAPGVKHWHGAAKDSWFSHLAIEVPGENTHNQWCEEVSNEEYKKLKY